MSPPDTPSGSTAGGTVVLRRLNRGAVLDALRRAAPAALRITELTQRTGLARPTVALVVADLVAEGLLVQLAPGAGRRMGRPATRVALNGAAAQVLGLDIGPHSVTASIADLTGRTLALARRVGGAPHATELLAMVDAAARDALATAGIPAEKIAAVGVGSPGVIDHTSHRARLVPSIPGWEHVDLVEHFRQTFSCPIELDNDANLAALAIHRARSRGGTVLAVYWGDRIGAGIVVDHRLLRGHSAAAGEIGYIPVDAAGDATQHDGMGPLEASIGAAAIGRRARSLAPDHPESLLAAYLAEGEDPAAATFAAAAAGDVRAAELVDLVAGTFARSVAPIVLALDPEAVVIGGGIARAGEGLRAAVARRLAPLVLFPPAVELSPLAQNAVVTGAIQVALEEAWRILLGTTPT